MAHTVQYTYSTCSSWSNADVKSKAEVQIAYTEMSSDVKEILQNWSLQTTVRPRLDGNVSSGYFQAKAQAVSNGSTAGTSTLEYRQLSAELSLEMESSMHLPSATLSSIAICTLGHATIDND